MGFIKNGKEYLILKDGKEIGKMYKDNSRNYQFAIVAEFNFKVKGYRNIVSGKTYKAVKVEAEKLYNNLVEYIEKGFELV